MQQKLNNHKTTDTMKATFKTDTGFPIATFNVNPITGECEPIEIGDLYERGEQILNISVVDEIISHMIGDTQTLNSFFPANMYGFRFYIELTPTAKEYYLMHIANNFGMYDTAEKLHNGEFKRLVDALNFAHYEAITPRDYNITRHMVEFIFENK